MRSQSFIHLVSRSDTGSVLFDPHLTAARVHLVQMTLLEHIF